MRVRVRFDREQWDDLVQHVEDNASDDDSVVLDVHLADPRNEVNLALVNDGLRRGELFSVGDVVVTGR